MHEIKLTIDGKEVAVTEEQLSKLGIELGNKNPFEYVRKDKTYYFVGTAGNVDSATEHSSNIDNKRKEYINYFNDKKFAHQIACRQTLNRLLLKFAYDNDYVDIAPWDGQHAHYYIYYHAEYNQWRATATTVCKENVVYFNSVKGAQLAIEDVVKPFIKVNPSFDY